MNPTPTVIKSLAILSRLNDEIAPREFGEMLWGTDHPGWRRVSKAGAYGSSRGGGMNLAAGAWLGKMAKNGWCQRYRRGWFITTEGRRVLHANVLITSYPDTRSRAHRGAFIKGFKAAARGARKSANPYNYYETNSATCTWSRSYHRYWERGWTHFQDCIDALSTPKPTPTDV